LWRLDSIARHYLVAACGESERAPARPGSDLGHGSALRKLQQLLKLERPNRDLEAPLIAHAYRRQRSA
jgi:hypothetical protein